MNSPNPERGKKKLKVLHLASFSGNIGDVANHFGAQTKFQEIFDFKFETTQIEIREFYWKQRAFDSDFIAYANTFDLLLIGGGNYFELWVEKSATGTSIDIKSEDFANLTVPTLFYSLGVDIGQGYTEKTASRFKAFLLEALRRDNVFVSVRNDGSRRALIELFGVDIANRVSVIADGGFFAREQRKLEHSNQQVIGINIAGDMLDQRFNGEIDASEFLNQMAAMCMSLIDELPEIKIELVPHIWRDVTIISTLMDKIADPYLRRNIVISELEPTTNGLMHFLDKYQTYDLVLGTRFHSNVCPIGMTVPTRGLYCYPQIRLLYEELGLDDRLVNVRKKDFKETLTQSLLQDLQQTPALRARYKSIMTSLNESTNISLRKVNQWLLENLG